MAHQLGDEAAQSVRTSYEQLKDVRKGGDWITQLSNQDLSSDVLDVQYLYGCRCGIMPLKSSHCMVPDQEPRRERILDLHSVWQEICPIALTSIFRREASGSGGFWSGIEMARF